MLRPIHIATVVSALALIAVTAGLAGCPVGDGSSDDAREGEGEGEGEDEDRCVTGCEATIVAACDNGPASQAQCEADCTSLRAGPCATSYEALLQCDGVVACDAGGIPTVTGCEAEQATFRSCLSG